MTSQINQLIAKEATQQRTIGLFQEGMIGQRAGIIPSIQPRIIPEQQQIIPERPIPIRPVNPQIYDPSKKKPDDDSAEKTLEEIRKEILDKLSPADRKKAEEQINKEKEDNQPVEPVEPQPVEPKPVQPVEPSLRPATKIDENDFETNLGIQFGNKRLNLKSPKGFYAILTRYRRLNIFNYKNNRW